MSNPLQVFFDLLNTFLEWFSNGVNGAGAMMFCGICAVCVACGVIGSVFGFINSLVRRR